MSHPTTGPQVDPKVAVYLSILDGAAILLANPLLGIQEVGRVTALIGFAGTLIRNIAIGADELKVVNDEIRMLISQGRGPSEEEWNRWKQRLYAVDARIDSIASSLGGGS